MNSTAPRLEYREGHLDRARDDLPGALKRLRTLASRSELLRHFVSAVPISSHLRERPRFIVNQLRRPGGVPAYCPRTTGAKVGVRRAAGPADGTTPNSTRHLGPYSFAEAAG